MMCRMPLFPSRKLRYDIYVLLIVAILFTEQSSSLLNVPKEDDGLVENGFHEFVRDKLQTSIHTRNKRWDYGADGCHCNGYSVECLQDAYCQWKMKSPLWSCRKNCCGFKCVLAGRDD